MSSPDDDPNVDAVEDVVDDDHPLMNESIDDDMGSEKEEVVDDADADHDADADAIAEESSEHNEPLSTSDPADDVDHGGSVAPTESVADDDAGERESLSVGDEDTAGDANAEDADDFGPEPDERADSEANAADDGDVAPSDDATAGVIVDDVHPPSDSPIIGGDGHAALSSEAEGAPVTAVDSPPVVTEAETVVSAAQMTPVSDALAAMMFAPEAVETAPPPIKETRPVPQNVLTLRSMLRDAHAELADLTAANVRLQARIRKHHGNATAPAPAAPAVGISSRMTDSKVQYAKKVDQVAELYNVFRAKQDTFNGKIDRLNARLDEEDENAAELRESFKEFKREICKAAVFSRTGGGISMKKIEKFEALEMERDRELERLRLKNIHFRNQLKKLEIAVKQKEQLSEGLHLIDFEQLKIENQTLNEKIEERNDDLHKLKKKITTTVQVMTHIKEKLQFVELDNVVLKEKLAGLDSQMQALRDQVTKAKRIRDRLRNETSKLKERQGFVGSTLLVKDFESRKVELRRLEQEIETLRARHGQLTAKKVGEHGPAATASATA